MHAEYLLIDDSRHREVVEAVRESLPQLHRVPELDLFKPNNYWEAGTHVTNTPELYTNLCT